MNNLMENIDMEFFYDIQDGDYIWHASQDNAQTIGPEISVLFDRCTGTLIKHGIPRVVYSCYLKMVEALKEIQAEDDLVILVGKVPLDKINLAISCSNKCHEIFSSEVEKVSCFTDRSQNC